MKLKAQDYKKLCRKIYRKYRPQFISYFDACGACDAVLFGEMTEAKLIEMLDLAKNDEAQ